LVIEDAVSGTMPQVRPVQKAAPVMKTETVGGTAKKNGSAGTPAATNGHSGSVAKTQAVRKKAKPIKRHTCLVTFRLKFHTGFGQNLFITGDHALLGNNDPAKAIALQYLDDETWQVALEWPTDEVSAEVHYSYVLRNQDGTLSFDWGNDKIITPQITKSKEVLMVDTWNHAGYYENVFYTEPFVKVLLKAEHPRLKAATGKYTHRFHVKSPLLQNNQTLCLSGNHEKLGNWDTSNPLQMRFDEATRTYIAQIDLSAVSFPLAYKYGVYDVSAKRFVRFEDGNNRVLYDGFKKNRSVEIHDGFAVLPLPAWKGGGVAIPVFSLRSDKSFGTGEFSDLRLLADWSKRAGIKLIQLLPVNDTTAHHDWMDSYPYAAISAFALHPLYLNLAVMAGVKQKKIVAAHEKKRKELNALPVVDYDAVMKAKWALIREIYPLQKARLTTDKDYLGYFDTNKHWLIPYAVFCHLRDIYDTPDFSKWPSLGRYDEAAVQAMALPASEAYDSIAIHFFVQYHLHLQLRDATEYAHRNGVIIKGDIAIGTYRYGADTWQQPDLYRMDLQAGAPPDDFAVKGQNWGFPVYNWKRMREDGYAWWKQRFTQMSFYFDAFRIDHILGFFRIWSIPVNAVEGIMGYFVPAIPVQINEFAARHIRFDLARFTQPYITDEILQLVFDGRTQVVKETFLETVKGGGYSLRPAFGTQRQVEQYFSSLEDNAENDQLRTGLYDLISNVILFEVANSNGTEFHFRLGMENTFSFRHLDAHTREALKELYIDYFFRRQDGAWKKEALEKLPSLKKATNMLVCGEDLGMVPDSVPEVMKELGLLSLEIQRMPKDQGKEYSRPAEAPYLSVVTPSTHDMSTIRAWWEENPHQIQKIFEQELGQHGAAPHPCPAWVNKALVLQHLYSPAMWSIFQWQDLAGMNEDLRRDDPSEERINVPANPKNYWQYRMHITLEKLLENEAFTDELQGYFRQSGR